MRRLLGVAVTLAAATVLAACGGGSKTSAPAAPKTFSEAGLAVHFQYPGSFGPWRVHSVKSAGQSSQALVGVGLGPLDLIAVSRYQQAAPFKVTKANVKSLKAHFDGYATQAFGHTTLSTVGTLGGRPALLYARQPYPGEANASIRLALVFVGHDEYELQCLATTARLATMDKACNRMLSTLTVTGA